MRAVQQTCSRRASQKRLKSWGLNQRQAELNLSACGKVESLLCVDGWPARDKWAVTYHLKVKETMILLAVATTMLYVRGISTSGRRWE